MNDMTDTGKPPRRGGKRLFEPIEEQMKNIKTLVALGIPAHAICAIIRDHKDRPISEPTLRMHFKKEIETGATELNTQVGSFLVATILGIDPRKGVKPITDDKIRSFRDIFPPRPRARASRYCLLPAA